MTTPNAGDFFYEYHGRTYPDWIRGGRAADYIMPFARQVCLGVGFDVGCGRALGLPICGPPRSLPVDIDYPYTGCSAESLPMIRRRAPPVPHEAMPWEIVEGASETDTADYVFSSHCLEHVADPVAALRHWRSRLRDGGTLFLYLPHPDMEYWRPWNNPRHLHLFHPSDAVEMVGNCGFHVMASSERDLYWSYSIVGEAR